MIHLRRTCHARAGAFAVWLAALLLAGAARANGAFPDSQSIMTPESLPHAIRLATNFGVVASDDDGQTWLWSCEQPETNNGSLYQMGPANRIYTVSSVGLAFSDNGSCGWSVARGAVAGATVLDAFPDPTNGSRVLAVAATSGDAGISYAVLESSDGGATFGPTRYTAVAGDHITGVEIARSAPSTIYVAMTSGPAFGPKLARSTNGGTSWEVDDLSAKLPTKTNLIRLVAVDPQNADRVYLRVRSPAGEAFAVAVAAAGGFTVTTPLTFPDGILSAYARLASGTIVLAAVVGVDEVGYRSTDGGASFQPLPTPPSVRALSARGTTLYAVADNVVDGYAVATSIDEGQSWRPLLRYEQIAAIQSCVKAACQVDCLARAAAGQWSEDFCAATAPASLDAGSAAPDAGGPPDAGGAGGSGGSSDASVSPPPKTGCSCAVTAPATPGALPFIAVLMIAVRVRRGARGRAFVPPVHSAYPGREGTGGTGGFRMTIAGLVMCVAIAIAQIRSVGRLKRVALTDTAVHVSNFWREIAVPLGDVEAVDHVDSGLGRVAISFARDTAFGQRMEFTPIGLFSPTPHPIIAGCALRWQARSAHSVWCADSVAVGLCADFRCGRILPKERSVAVMNDASERRAAQRFELFAQANVASGGDVYVMTVRNISGAGAFLEGRPREHADLAPGVEIEVSLSATAPGMGDDEMINIDCRGRVARVEMRTPSSPGGFGITLEPKTAEDQERLEDLLSRLIDLPPAERPASIG